MTPEDIACRDADIEWRSEKTDCGDCADNFLYVMCEL